MYFIGDTHGLRSLFQIIDKHKLESQNLIHVGDLGLGFQDVKRDIANLEVLEEALNETGNNLYAIRGNHDNPIFWNGNLRLPKFHNIHLVRDHTFLNIEKKRLYLAGGATSIDRIIRMNEAEPTWWSGEKYQRIDEKTVLPGIDIVVTHTAPDFAYPQNDYVEIVNHYCDIESKHGSDLRKELREERKDLSDLHAHIIREGSRPTHWIYGHFHKHYEEIHDNTKFIGLGINELYKLK